MCPALCITLRKNTNICNTQSDIPFSPLGFQADQRRVRVVYMVCCLVFLISADTLQATRALQLGSTYYRISTLFASYVVAD